MKYNEIVERHAPRLGLNNLVTGEPCKPFVYMDYVDDGMWVHYVTYCENIRRQKRKRCLAMARIASDDFHLHNSFYAMGKRDFELRAMNRCEKHRAKWLELADKLKE